MKTILIHQEPVELYKILKFEGLCPSGGEAKNLIAAGFIQVNNAVETRKRRKIVSGDTLQFNGEAFVIQLQ